VRGFVILLFFVIFAISESSLLDGPLSSFSISFHESGNMTSRQFVDKASVLSMGPDGQALKKNIILMPGHWAKYDPFLLMAEDWFSQESGGFPSHPHRGFETVTLVLDGKLEHSDSKGNKGILSTGDVQWMTAAGGIVHSELAHADSIVHCLQLWLNLPAKNKMDRTRYQDLLDKNIPVVEKDGTKVRVISGTHAGIRGPAENIVPVLLLDVELTRNGAFSTELPASFNGFVYVLEGRGVFGRDRLPLAAGEVALLKPSDSSLSVSKKIDSIEVQAMSDRVRFVLVTGQPTREPVHARGPFVMDSEEKLAQAFRDYRSDDFIH